MCCCTNNATGRPSSKSRPLDPTTVVLRVDDMTCGHCARTIKDAVERDLPGTEAIADPAAKTVTVRGTADAVAVRRAVASAGYTPAPAA